MSEVIDMLTADNPRATIGGNFPPLKEFFADINENLEAQLEADAKELLDRVKALVDAEARMPKHIADGDEDNAGKITAFTSQIIKCIKSAEAKREDLTEGPLASQRKIMAFYRTKIYQLLGEGTADKKTGKFGGLRDRVGDILTDYERRKVEIARKALEEEQRKAREAAIEAERIAAAERDRVAREAAAAAEAQRVTEEAIRNETDLAKAVAMEDENKRLAAMREAESRAAAESAQVAADAATQAAAAADQKSSTLSRTEGWYGTSSSLRENWKARVTSYDAIKADPKAMAMVWEQLKPEAIEDACGRIAKLKKNTVKIAGVEFYDGARATVRG